MPVLTLRRFEGGLTTEDPADVPDQMTPDVDGAFLDEGSVRPITGTSCAGTVVAGLPVYGVREWRIPGTDCLVAKCGRGVYVNMGDNVFRPLVQRTPNLVESWQGFGARLYMANGTDEVMRWDGSAWYQGTVSCASGTHVTGVGTGWTALSAATVGNPAQGNSICFGTAPVRYTVRQALSATGLRLVHSGPNVSSVKYMAADTFKAGIDAPGTAPSLVGLGPGGQTLHQDYIWAYTYYSTRGDKESDSSPVTMTTATGTNTAFRVSGWPTLNEDPKVDNVIVYRTEGDGAQLYHIATLSRGTDYTFPTHWDDLRQDDSIVP